MWEQRGIGGLVHLSRLELLLGNAAEKWQGSKWCQQLHQSFPAVLLMSAVLFQ